MLARKDVSLFRPKYRVDECLQEIRECLEIGWTGIGFKTIRFEEEWGRYTGLPHTLFVNSATAALHLAVSLLKQKGGWQAGDEVITTGQTFVSSNAAIVYEGLDPVFAAIDDSLNITPESVERMISERTRAIMFVGIGGNPAHYREIAGIARARAISLILDAAHMAGTRVQGSQIGQDADAVVFSFHAVKNLPTADAGALCMADGSLDARARELSWLGISKDTFARSDDEGNYDWEYDIRELGYKYHGNSIAASMALVGLKYLDEDNARRQQIAALYEQHLSNVEGVKFVEHDTGSARHLCQILVDNRNQLIAALKKEGISTGVHYKDNRRYAPFSSYRYDDEHYQNYTDRILSLPVHMELSDEDVLRVAEAIRSNL